MAGMASWREIVASDVAARPSGEPDTRVLLPAIVGDLCSGVTFIPFVPWCGARGFRVFWFLVFSGRE
jgi:hypothetical protein